MFSRYVCVVLLVSFCGMSCDKAPAEQPAGTIAESEEAKPNPVPVPTGTPSAEPPGLIADPANPDAKTPPATPVAIKKDEAAAAEEAKAN